MRNENGSKILAIIALCVGVVGLTIGFAAFSNTLTISSSASVKPDASTFSVAFSTTATTDSTTLSASNYATEGGASVDSSKIVVSGTTISGLNANFTAPGQTVTYTFYARNKGQYIAYLNSVASKAISGDSLFKKCTPATGTTAAMVTAACENINVKVSAGGYESLFSTAAPTANTPTSHPLAIGGNETITVTIQYTGDVRADGDFSVEFGSVELTYDSVD